LDRNGCRIAVSLYFAQFWGFEKPKYLEALGVYVWEFEPVDAFLGGDRHVHILILREEWAGTNRLGEVANACLRHNKCRIAK
jgi:hypothetical protein